MSASDRPPIHISNINIVLATAEDLPAVLALFDEAVRWLVAQGWSGQWGTEPFSSYPEAVERFAAWIREGIFYVARSDAAILGTIVINPGLPSYIAQQRDRLPQPALYLEAFATDRRYSGHGIGRRLLGLAEQAAQEQGIAWLLLDCWAGNAALRRYYRQAGFAECGAFTLGSWQGMLFKKQLSP
jgi:GNAT superfamily N-acetyltransferase